MYLFNLSIGLFGIIVCSIATITNYLEKNYRWVFAMLGLLFLNILIFVSNVLDYIKEVCK